MADSPPMLNEGLLVIARRYSGTQVARLISSPRPGVWRARFLSATSCRWTQPRELPESEILGSFGTQATRAHRRALELVRGYER